jgi:large subunit ribosomal protein L10
MKREEKQILLNELIELVNNQDYLYVVDISGLDSVNTFLLRSRCFKENIKLQVVKNTLLHKAMLNSNKDFSEMYPILNGPTAIMYGSTANNAPAKLIKKFRENSDKPILKGAYIEGVVFIGDNQLNTLATLKTREELIADVALALNNPFNKLLSSLQGQGQKIAGVLKTLAEKE